MKIPEFLPGAVVSALVSGTGALSPGKAGLVLLATAAAAMVVALARLNDDVA